MIDRTHVDLEVPPEVRWITETLENAGREAWVVGGGVRDALAGLSPEDWDVTTAARPGEVLRLFRRTVPIGIDHGTVGVLAHSGKMYEVTTFRRDVETFGRKARVEFAETLEEDLERRDFTINAVAWRPRTKELRDPHGGRRDLEGGVLRTVGDAEARFAEDRLRVLRALRFAGRFELEVEERTWSAVRASAGSLGDLSPERVREELMKVLSGQRTPSRTLRLYAESGVLEEMYPELASTVGVPAGPGIDHWSRTLIAIDTVPRTRPLVRLAALLHTAGRTAEAADGAGAVRRSAALARETMLRLRSSNADTDTVTHLVAQSDPLPEPNAPDPEIRRWVRRVGPEHINNLIRLLIAICRGSSEDSHRSRELIVLSRRARKVVRERVPLTIRDLPISGEDLKGLGFHPGPRFGVILEDLLERVTDDPSLNDRAALLQLASEMKG